MGNTIRLAVVLAFKKAFCLKFFKKELCTPLFHCIKKDQLDGSPIPKVVTVGKDVISETFPEGVTGGGWREGWMEE